MPGNPKQRVKAYEHAKKLEDPQNGERLLVCYDRIRQSAAKHDAGSVLEVVKLLEQSLNYQANPLFAWRLQKLYNYIRECINKENFPEACRVANELFLMWQQGLASASESVDSGEIE